jgi:hypothetical protein
VTERAEFRLVIEQRYRHQMIMPSLAIFSPARSQAGRSNVRGNQPRLPVPWTRRMSRPHDGGISGHAVDVCHKVEALRRLGPAGVGQDGTGRRPQAGQSPSSGSAPPTSGASSDASASGAAAADGRSASPCLAVAL